MTFIADLQLQHVSRDQYEQWQKIEFDTEFQMLQGLEAKKRSCEGGTSMERQNYH